MDIAQIEKNLELLAKNTAPEEFIFDLLLAYGIPKATITLLKKGSHNLGKKEGQVILKKKLFFQAVKDADLHATIDELQKDPQTMRHSPRFIVVCGQATCLAIDTKTQEHLDVAIKDVARHYDFFLPWAGMEKHKHKNENPADRKAAEKMARLYDVILEENGINDNERTHGLNIFLARLLFCFFAEDTSIFADGIFTDAIASHTTEDGHNLDSYLEKLFLVLDQDDAQRSGLPEYLKKFPYVNGSLFKEKRWTPKFSGKSRKILIECGELNWSEVNPDIFGSMMQAVTHPGERASLGMHFTSVPNIMKVIGPLFLDELRKEFEENIGNRNALLKLLNRLNTLKVFDPACGSGNFLIISYKELRRLEMDILVALNSAAYFPSKLKNFFGIEIDDFAHEIAKVSLYIAEHQMNQEFQKRFGTINPTLPLKAGGQIVCGNATRVLWEQVCPKTPDDEVYILGNPPYLGSFLQNKDQKADLAHVCKGLKSYKDLDYIACWFIKAADYIENSRAKFAFVTTNSICQGEQVILLWPHIFRKNLEIYFAYKSFKWANNAKANAGVYCVIIGIRRPEATKKKIFSVDTFGSVDNITPYLTTGRTTIVSKRMKPLSGLPVMNYGSKIVDNGHLIFTDEERRKLLIEYPEAESLFKKLAGSVEFIRGLSRWVLYINESDLALAQSIAPIRRRLDLVKEFRNKSSEASTVAMAAFPHRFYYSVHNNSEAIIIPRTSSERREYIPIGFLNGETIVSDAASVVFNAEPWIFSVLTSRMHMSWVRAVAGRLKTDYRYSSQLCYNTFPIPPLTQQNKMELTRHAYAVLHEREQHSQMTLAQLYDPDKMPSELRAAHSALDLAVDRLYRSKIFANDEDRLEHLFALYERMVAEEKEKVK